MQGVTHRAGGVTACLAGYSLLVYSGSPLVAAAPVASLACLYPFAVWGATASDLDHAPGGLWDELKPIGQRSGQSLPSQDVVSRAISHVLHATKPLRGVFPKGSRAGQLVSVLDCKHRSWQTHSELPLAVILYFLSKLDPTTGNLSSALTQLILMGIGFGLVAHLILDLLTPEGLPFATGLFINKFILRKHVLPERIKIIPHVPPTQKGKPGFFSTGGTWETKIVFNALHAINIVLLIVTVAKLAGFALPSLVV
jgi:hypothetical protein